jgi:two-component system sensor histidine kinase ArlS
MPVKIKITLFFTLIVFTILTVVCLSIYYFAYENREGNFRIRLTNRAMTTARLLGQRDVFNRSLIQKIDANTSVAMFHKSIQAYDNMGNPEYVFSDKADDTITVSTELLVKAKKEKSIYFREGEKDVVVYHYEKGNFSVTVVAGAYDPEGKKNLDQLRFVLWLCFFGGILLTVGAGYFFSKSLLQPIRKIADDVNEITAQNLAKRIKASALNDEWSYLTGTLNVLLNRLEESFQTQGRFIANASHELSTPLTSIFSQLEVSLQKERDAKDYRLIIQSVLEDVHRLNRLTHTLLQFASASGTSTGLEINLVRIDEVLLRMPREMKNANAGYHVKLDFNELPLNEDNLLVFGNEQLIFSAIKNIVLNACKYSDNHVAFIKLVINGEKTNILVTDTGKGISPEALPYIFQPFYREKDVSPISGFGLGLSLSLQIMKLHKGEITVDSTPGKGSTFIIVFPLAINNIS